MAWLGDVEDHRLDALRANGARLAVGAHAGEHVVAPRGERAGGGRSDARGGAGDDDQLLGRDLVTSTSSGGLGGREGEAGGGQRFGGLPQLPCRACVPGSGGALDQHGCAPKLEEA